MVILLMYIVAHISYFLTLVSMPRWATWKTRKGDSFCSLGFFRVNSTFKRRHGKESIPDKWFLIRPAATEPCEYWLWFCRFSAGFWPQVSLMFCKKFGIALRRPIFCTSLISKLRRTLMVFSDRPPLVGGIAPDPVCSDTTSICCSESSTFSEETKQALKKYIYISLSSHLSMADRVHKGNINQVKWGIIYKSCKIYKYYQVVMNLHSLVR